MTTIINNYVESINLVKSRVDKITFLISKETDAEKIRCLSKRRLLLYEEIREMDEIIRKLEKYEMRGDSYGKKD